MAAAQTLADVASADAISAQARADLQTSSDQARDAALHDSLHRTAEPGADVAAPGACPSARGAVGQDIRALLPRLLDRFKVVNDTYGHHVGNELLVAVAERLTTVLQTGRQPGPSDQ